MSTSENEVRIGFRQTWGGVLLAMGLVTLLSLLTYDWEDIGILKAPPNVTARNCFGPAGAWLSFLLFAAFGLAAYVVPVWCFVFGRFLMFKPEKRLRSRVVWMLVFMFALASLLEVHEGLWSLPSHKLNLFAAGGVITRLVTRRLLVNMLFEEVGTTILAGLVLLLATVNLFGFGTFAGLYGRTAGLFRFLRSRFGEWRTNRMDERKQIEEEERRIEKQRARLQRTVRREKPPAPAVPPAVRAVTEPGKTADQREKPVEPRAEKSPAAKDKSAYVLPPVDLLDDLPPAKDRAIRSDIATTSKILRETLEEFAIESEIINVEQGPVVTRYELRPAAGVRVERIAGLSNNLALALKATSVRVQAPVPGKGVVGVEVPNTTSSMVFLREIIEGKTWQESKAALPLALGKDVGGADVIADLAVVPHLLIAGATGSGKTVCINSILVGLLMCRTPEQLRLMLVDPKIVELSSYNKLPHLLSPVITDPHKVALGLRWTINEMEKRYKLFAKTGVRNIESFNNRPVEKYQDLFIEGKEETADGVPASLPYIVIVVDELADLMLVAQADIENCIARLAQLSRAVGIHMILATQRPSVNVITGTIKANFPARLAFQVAQRVDSRTILDANGADKLLGRGDMLFLPPGSNKMIRAQGAMVTDHETKRVADFIKDQAEPDYEVAIHEKMESSSGGDSADMEENVDDGLMEQAVEIIRETRRASTSSLQRRLRIGYTRAARLMDVLEQRGVVGPPRGSDPREILIDLDGDMPDNKKESPEAEDA